MDSIFTLTTTKNHSCRIVPVSERVGSQQRELFEQHNHSQEDVNLLLQSHIRATDEQMGFVQFFAPAKMMRHKIENEMHGYYILQLGKPDI